MSAESQPLPEGGPMGPPPMPPAPVHKRRSRLVIGFVAVAVLLLGLNAYLLYTKFLSSETPAAAVTTQPGPTQTGANAPPATTPGFPVATDSTKAPTRASTTTQPPTGPQIVYFRVQEQPSCPSSGPEAQFPGNPVVLEWKVTGADSTELSVDGPGLYGSYGLDASASLFFSCGGTSGSYQTHTYTLTTVGGGSAMSRTLTVKALVN